MSFGFGWCFLADRFKKNAYGALTESSPPWGRPPEQQRDRCRPRSGARHLMPAHSTFSEFCGKIELHCAALVFMKKWQKRSAPSCKFEAKIASGGPAGPIKVCAPLPRGPAVRPRGNQVDALPRGSRHVLSSFPRVIRTPDNVSRWTLFMKRIHPGVEYVRHHYRIGRAMWN